MGKIVHVLRQTKSDASVSDVVHHLRQNAQRDEAIRQATGGGPIPATVYSDDQIREIATALMHD